jgi:predicted alternative tryptophan synthase beta-subunit
MPVNAARLELQGRWRDRLETARQKYNVAVVRCSTAMAEQTQCSLPAPDGSYAVRIARQEESAARNEYMRLLRVVNDLIIQGTIPEEP